MGDCCSAGTTDSNSAVGMFFRDAASCVSVVTILFFFATFAMCVSYTAGPAVTESIILLNSDSTLASKSVLIW